MCDSSGVLCLSITRPVSAAGQRLGEESRMPRKNRFQHQIYPTTPVLKPVLKKIACQDVVPGAFHSLHTRHEIGRVVLVHGTFVGDDPIGVAEMFQSLSEGIPVIGVQLAAIADTLRENVRPMTDSFVQDIGNYTAGFRDTFQELVGDDPQIEVMEPSWSSQNHHLARADLAVRLLHQLLQRPLPDRQKILYWGHSHAGNAFALLTNLLANDRESVQAFFTAAGTQVGEHWKAVRLALTSAPTPHPLAEQVVIVTFGTPVRYGWDNSGCCQLAHVLFHRPYDPEQPFLTMPLFPPHAVKDMLAATWGDWVQAFAIAGTDVPSAMSLSSNERLAALLEANLPEPARELDTSLIFSKALRDTCERWKLGTRCHSDGLNMLIDYIPSGQRTSLGQELETTVMGHGVATTLKWLPAHLHVVMEALEKTAN